VDAGHNPIESFDQNHTPLTVANWKLTLVANWKLTNYSLYRTELANFPIFLADEWGKYGIKFQKHLENKGFKKVYKKNKKKLWYKKKFQMKNVYY